MGVSQLWQILEPVRRRRGLKELQGMTLAVDLSAWIVDSNAVRQMQGAVVKPHLRNLFFRIQHLLQLEITPVFVLEGKAPELKLEVLSKRNQARYGARGGGAYRARAQGNRSQLARVIRECCEMLDYLGLPYVESAGEAEAMCAFLNQETMVEACITQDGDAFLYGARTVIRNFTVTGKEPVVEIYRMDDIERTLSLNRERLVGLAILLGCDYNPKGVPGVGKEQAMKLIQGLPSHQSLLDRFSRWQSAQFISELSRDAELRPLPHCKTCGHPGSSRDHTVSGCPLCRTARLCAPSDVDFQCPCEWHERKASVEGKTAELAICRKAGQLANFPDKNIIDEFLRSQNRRPTKSFRWRRPDIRKLWSFNLDVLTWPETYTTEKIVPLMTLWDLRQAGQAGTGQVLLPNRIVKGRTRQGVPCYEVEWEKLEDDCTTESEYYTTLEEQTLFSRCYPDVVAKFETDNGRKTSKKKAKKTAKPAPELEDLADALSQSLHIGATAPHTVIMANDTSSKKVGKTDFRRTFDSDSDDDHSKSLEFRKDVSKSTRWTCESTPTQSVPHGIESICPSNMDVKKASSSVPTSKYEVAQTKMTSNVSSTEKSSGKECDDRSASESEEEFNVPLSQRLAMMKKKKKKTGEPPRNTMKPFCSEIKIAEPVGKTVSPLTKPERKNTEPKIDSIVADCFAYSDEISLLGHEDAPSAAVNVKGDGEIPMTNSNCNDASDFIDPGQKKQQQRLIRSENDDESSRKSSNSNVSSEKPNYSNESSEKPKVSSAVSTIKNMDTDMLRDSRATVLNLPVVKKEPIIGEPEVDEEIIEPEVKKEMDDEISRVITDEQAMRSTAQANCTNAGVGVVSDWRKRDACSGTNEPNRGIRVKIEKPGPRFTARVKTETLREEPAKEPPEPVQVRKEIVPTVTEVRIKVEEKNSEVPRMKCEPLSPVGLMNDGKALVPADKIKIETKTNDVPQVKREISGPVNLTVDRKPDLIIEFTKPECDAVVVKQENECSESTVKVKQEKLASLPCSRSNPQPKVSRMKQENGSEPAMPVAVKMENSSRKNSSRLKIRKETLESQNEVKSVSDGLIVKNEPITMKAVKENAGANISKCSDTCEPLLVKTEPVNSPACVAEDGPILQSEAVKRETALPKCQHDDYPIMLSDEGTVSDYSQDSRNSDIESIEGDLDNNLTQSPQTTVESEPDDQCPKFGTEMAGGFLPDAAEFCWDDSCDNITLVAKENPSCHSNTSETYSSHGNSDGSTLASTTDDVGLYMSKTVRFKIEPPSETFSGDIIDLCDSDEDDVTNHVDDGSNSCTDNNASKIDFPTDDIISCGGNFNDDTQVENQNHDPRIDTDTDVDTVLSQTFFDRLEISDNPSSGRTRDSRTLSDKTNFLSDTILSQNITEMIAEVEADVKKTKKTRRKKTKSKIAANFGPPVAPQEENSPRINGDVLSDSFINGLASETMAPSDSKLTFLSSKFLSPLTPVLKPKRPTRARTKAKAKLSSQKEPEVTVQTNNAEGAVGNCVPYGNFSLMTSLLNFDATMDDSKLQVNS